MIHRISFAQAQSAWDNASPNWDGPELPNDYPKCLWCDEPTGPEWKDWNGVKRPAEDGPDGYCEDCWEAYGCIGCNTVSHDPKDDIIGLCPACRAPKSLTMRVNLVMEADHTDMATIATAIKRLLEGHQLTDSVMIKEVETK